MYLRRRFESDWVHDLTVGKTTRVFQVYLKQLGFDAYIVPKQRQSIMSLFENKKLGIYQLIPELIDGCKRWR